MACSYNFTFKLSWKLAHWNHSWYCQQQWKSRVQIFLWCKKWPALTLILDLVKNTPCYKWRSIIRLGLHFCLLAQPFNFNFNNNNNHEIYHIIRQKNNNFCRYKSAKLKIYFLWTRSYLTKAVGCGMPIMRLVGKLWQCYSENIS